MDTLARGVNLQASKVKGLTVLKGGRGASNTIQEFLLMREPAPGNTSAASAKGRDLRHNDKTQTGSCLLYVCVPQGYLAHTCKMPGSRRLGSRSPPAKPTHLVSFPPPGRGGASSDSLGIISLEKNTLLMRHTSINLYRTIQPSISCFWTYTI